ncbi:MAG: hypothetical protein J7513_15060 [Solirubrobacteraceae bacterium]|nr:hypothetical protein [Solirubrobacteraceae bacterium]
MSARVASPVATGLRPGRTVQSSALRWLPTFAGFPLGAVAAKLVAGPIDDLTAAVVGGAISGAVLGAAQGTSLFGRTRPAVGWALATAAGLAAGLGLGSELVGHGTQLSDLALQGAVSGAGIGLAQAIVLRRAAAPLATVWPVALAALWALGWSITTAIGVDVEAQYTVFGSSGALVVTLVTAALPATLAARSQA